MQEKKKLFSFLRAIRNADNAPTSIFVFLEQTVLFFEDCSVYLSMKSSIIAI